MFSNNIHLGLVIIAFTKSFGFKKKKVQNSQLCNTNYSVFDGYSLHHQVHSLQCRLLRVIIWKHFLIINLAIINNLLHWEISYLYFRKCCFCKWFYGRKWLVITGFITARSSMPVGLILSSYSVTYFLEFYGCTKETWFLQPCLKRSSYITDTSLAKYYFTTLSKAALMCTKEIFSSTSSFGLYYKNVCEFKPFPRRAIDKFG